MLVISSGARDLAFSVTCEEKISRLLLEMTIATQSPTGEGQHGAAEANMNHSHPGSGPGQALYPPPSRGRIEIGDSELTERRTTDNS
jgi:hypothetical protein